MKTQPAIAGARAPITLSKAILLYESESPDYIQADVLRLERGEEPSAPRCAVSLHDVFTEQPSGCPVIGPGRALERGRLDELLRQLQTQGAASKRELLPQRLLFADNSMLLWHVPACTRDIYFSTADKEFNRDVNARRVAHPPLLFKATPSMLYVWALASGARPDVKTPLFVAPYCNLYENGSMCRGDVKLPGTLAPTAIPAWEAIFYDSRFTHTNLGGKITAHQGGHNGLWRTQVDAESFDAKWLLPTKLNVGEVLK